MKLNRGTWTAAVLLLAACAGDEQDTAAETRADSTLVPTVMDSAPAAAPAATAAPVPSAPQPAAPGIPPAPTAEDSAAAARDDVSPEWKQRSRAMASYTQCMEQAKAADNALRPRLEAACGRLPTAP